MAAVIHAITLEPISQEHRQQNRRGVDMTGGHLVNAIVLTTRYAKIAWGLGGLPLRLKYIM